MEFEWDGKKAEANLSKHEVSFDEAKTVFDDPLYIDFYDPDYSEEEDRYIIIGESQQRRLLIVSYTERDHIAILNHSQGDPQMDADRRRIVETRRSTDRIV